MSDVLMRIVLSVHVNTLLGAPGYVRWLRSFEGFAPYFYFSSQPSNPSCPSGLSMCTTLVATKRNECLSLCPVASCLFSYLYTKWILQTICMGCSLSKSLPFSQQFILTSVTANRNNIGSGRQGGFYSWVTLSATLRRDVWYTIGFRTSLPMSMHFVYVPE